MPQVADDLHEWVSFTDPEEDREWRFDVTFLASNWTCIFGRGCKGVLTEDATEMEQGCCSYGAHFTGAHDRRRTLEKAKLLTERQWQHKARAKRGVTSRNTDGTTLTKLVNEACIFLNGPDFPGGAGCALHRGAIDAGEHFIEWKPEVCWQVPLRREDHVRSDGVVETTVRSWDRRDWGGGGEEFHWWCTQAPEAFCGAEPVYVTSRAELVALCGERVYDLLVEYIAPRSTEIAPHPHAEPVTS